MVSDWHRIIPYGGGQDTAFEELICQLASNDKFGKNTHFERVGTPDGGVECYWVLEDGKEYGWQAKYYNDLTSSEWGSIKASLMRAAETHPELVRYYVCLPHNLADGRKGRVYQKDVWNEYKKEWEESFKNNGRDIEIVFWSSSIILSKLLEEKNKGIRLFFLKKLTLP